MDIKVTAEMVQLITDWFENEDSGRAGLNNVIRAIIELHEANKPKPEPYGYIAPNGIHPYDLWTTATLSVDAKSSGKWIPLYTAPQTREPLSDNQLHRFADKCTPNTETGGLHYKCFARLVEQAHGIGVKE